MESGFYQDQSLAICKIGQTFERLDKKTNISFKIPMWMYLKFRNKTKNNQKIDCRLLISRDFLDQFSSQVIFSFTDNGITVIKYLVKNLQISVRKINEFKICMKKHFRKSIRSNEDRGEYGFIQDYIRIKGTVQEHVRIGQMFERLDK